MKIGILTVPFNNNYGGLLQAYALKRVIEEMGHNVVFINRQRNPQKSFKLTVYRILVRFHIVEDFLANKIRSISKNTDLFKERYLTPISEPYYSSNELKKFTKHGFDFYVVGSDQVWRYEYAQDSIDDFFFGFLDNGAPRISYAASFGSDEMDYPECKRSEIKNLLGNFRALSVREHSGKKILVEYFGIPSADIRVVLDPTMLLNKNDYYCLFKDIPIDKAHYALTYVLDKEMLDPNVLNDYLSASGLNHLDIKAQTGKIMEQREIEPVEKWLSLIYNADYVITDSFHGTVFSILFNKKFVVLANPKRGIARLYSLLSMLGLENRLVSDKRINFAKILDMPVDWKDVDNRIIKKREESITFLNNSFS